MSKMYEHINMRVRCMSKMYEQDARATLHEAAAQHAVGELY
jgi:hypothetical protein